MRLLDRPYQPGHQLLGRHLIRAVKVFLPHVVRWLVAVGFNPPRVQSKSITDSTAAILPAPMGVSVARVLSWFGPASTIQLPAKVSGECSLGIINLLVVNKKVGCYCPPQNQLIKMVPRAGQSLIVELIKSDIAYKNKYICDIKNDIISQHLRRRF